MRCLDLQDGLDRTSADYIGYVQAQIPVQCQALLPTISNAFYISLSAEYGCCVCRMLATCMNALSLQAALEHVGVETRVQTAIEMRVWHSSTFHWLQLCWLHHAHGNAERCDNF